MKEQPIIVWFRQDLRLEDNPALHAACKNSNQVIPVFIWTPEELDPWAPGAASKWWLHHSLLAFSSHISQLGGKLCIREGDSLAELQKLIKETGAKAVYWNRLYDPAIIERDKKIKAAVTNNGIETKSFKSALLFEPWEIENSSKKPFQVFTHFWRKLKSSLQEITILAKPKSLSCNHVPKSLALSELKLLPRISWDTAFSTVHSPGETGAKALLKAFLKQPIQSYQSDRNIPNLHATSKLSAHLHFGEISPRVIWKNTERASKDGLSSSQAEVYLRQIAWREFAHHLLYHFPHTPLKSLKKDYEKFPWKKNKLLLKKWQQGLTGYPLVDAGMRELWTTGIMHNRVRMVVASFLVKHLLQPWQDGAKWFWDTLVDADLANNTMGWQWTAGCGADAQPYFRVFNPVLQGEKFDPNGDYVKRWVPELKDLPKKWLHKPWEAPEKVLADSGVSLGKSYPRPIIEHAEGRERALDAYEELKLAVRKLS
jgi:deoxyribodipyrimidine photo-lyase